MENAMEMRTNDEMEAWIHSRFVYEAGFYFEIC